MANETRFSMIRAGLPAACLALLVAIPFAAAEGVAATADDAPPKKTAESTISADEMEMDMKNGLAVFSGNVLISDATMSLTCDTVTLHFVDGQRISRVEAVGHVTIIEPKNKRKATARRAEYDLAKGTVVLSGDPVLEMEDRKLYNAETISYDLNSETVRTTSGEGRRPTIEFKTDGGGVSFDALLGGGGKPPEKSEVEEAKGSDQAGEGANE